MTRDVNKLGDVISPTVTSLRDQIGGLARVFDSKHRVGSIALSNTMRMILGMDSAFFPLYLFFMSRHKSGQ